MLCATVGGLMGLYLQGRVVAVLTSQPNTAESVNIFCKVGSVQAAHAYPRPWISALLDAQALPLLCCWSP